MVDNLDLCLIQRGDLNQDVLRVEGDLAVVSVDYGRQRENSTVRIVDYGVDRRVPDDVQVAAEVLVFLLRVSLEKDTRK